MAAPGRPPKTNLPYAKWDTNVFMDKDIIRLMDAQGCAGFVIYFFLAQMARMDHGYFYEWSYADAPITAKMVGGGVRSEAVIQTVTLCLRLGLFDKGLFDRHGILTSRRLQRSFVEATKGGRKYCAVREEYRLLPNFEKNEGEGLDNHTADTYFPGENPDFPDGNADFPPGNSDNNKNRRDLKEIRSDEKRRSRTRAREGPSYEEVREYTAARGWLEENTRFFYDLYAASGWRDSNGKPVKSWKQKAIYWERDARNDPKGRPISAAPAEGRSDADKLEAMKRMAKALGGARTAAAVQSPASPDAPPKGN